MKRNSKCPKAGTEICKKGRCNVYGTQVCIDAMPQPGNCSIRPCTNSCALYGTDFCKSGVVREIQNKKSNAPDFEKITNDFKKGLN